MSKLSDAEEAALAEVPSFQRDNARKALEAKYAKKETKKTTTTEE